MNWSDGKDSKEGVVSQKTSMARLNIRPSIENIIPVTASAIDVPFIFLSLHAMPQIMPPIPKGKPRKGIQLLRSAITPSTKLAILSALTSLLLPWLLPAGGKER